MQIFVKTRLSEKPLALEVESSDTMNVVRAKIHDQLRLMFGGKLLEDGSKTLADYSIRKGSELLLFPRSRCGGGIMIFIRTMTGNVLELEVDGSDTVKELKAMIENSEGIPVYDQRLIFYGRVLEDNSSLADCNVQMWSTVYLVPRLRGS